MSLYQYRVIQSDGLMAEGSIEAKGRQDAMAQLEFKGWKPVSLSEKANGSTNGNAKTSSGIGGLFKSAKVSFRDLENFTRMLSSLLAAGVPLSRALVVLCKEVSSPVAKEKWQEIHGLVIDGMSLADAMSHSPDIFPRVYSAMVEAGETGGFLDLVLSQISDFQVREKDLRSKVMTALIYPIVLLVLAVTVLVFLLVFFIPRFQSIFAGFDAALPLITRIIVGASEFVRSYGFFIALGIGGAVYLFNTWIKTDKGKRSKEEWLLRLPIVGPLVARFAMARFCRMLGTLIGADVPLINALNVARRSINNQILVDAVAQSIEGVKQGGQLAGSLSGCKQLFSGSVLEMIAVAEESGRLDQELVRLAEVTEQELDRGLKTAVALTEPIMLFMIATFIGFIFIGMVIPIFTIQDYIK